MIRTMVRTAFMTSVMVAAATSAQAQNDAGGIAGIVVSATTLEEGAHLGITGAMGYRFNRIVSLGLELTTVPSFDPELPDLPVPLPYAVTGNTTVFGPTGSASNIIIPSPPTYSFGDEEGHITIFTTNLRLDVPTGSRRWFPYIVGGAGVAHVQTEFTINTTFPPFLLTEFPVARYSIPPFSEEIEQSSTDMAVTLGGGIALRAGDHLTLELDARYLAVFGYSDLQIGRFGAGVSYRF
jgi:opacity protein-like surface antigen